MKKFLTLFVLVGLVFGLIACSNNGDDPNDPTYTITFNANGGAGTMAALRAAEGETVTLTANAFTRDGHNFMGWSLTSNGDVDYQGGAQFIMGAANVILYAVWEDISVIRHTIIFDSNGGTGNMAPQSVIENTTATLTTNAFTPPAGHRFSGWNTEANGSGTDYADGAQFEMEDEDVILYAVWAPITEVYINFNANGGSGTMATQIVPLNSSAALNANAFTAPTTPAGQTFAGWATSEFGVAIYADGANIQVQNVDINLFARWNGNPDNVVRYRITFDLNGGTGAILGTPLELAFGSGIPDIWVGDVDDQNYPRNGNLYFWGFWDTPEPTGGQRYYRFIETYPDDWWLEAGREGDPINWDKYGPSTLYGRWSTQMPPWWSE